MSLKNRALNLKRDKAEAKLAQKLTNSSIPSAIDLETNKEIAAEFLAKYDAQRARGTEIAAKNTAFQAARGRGRPKGTTNRMTREVKEVIADCFQRIGGIEAFAKWAKHNQTDFYRLYAKLLPVQLQGNGPGGAIRIVVSAEDKAL